LKRQSEATHTRSLSAVIIKSDRSNMSGTTAAAPEAEEAAGPPGQNYRDVARQIMAKYLYEKSESASKSASDRNAAALKCVAALFGKDVDAFLVDTTELVELGEIKGIDYTKAKELYEKLVLEIGDRPDLGRPVNINDLTKRAKWARHTYALWRKSQSLEQQQQTPLCNDPAVMWRSVIRECGGKNTIDVFYAYVWWNKARFYTSNPDWRCYPPDRSTLETFSAYYKWWLKCSKKGGAARTAAESAAAAAAAAAAATFVTAATGGDDATNNPVDNHARQGDVMGASNGAEEPGRERATSRTLGEERGQERATAAVPAVAVGGARAPRGVHQALVGHGGVGALGPRNAASGQASVPPPPRDDARGGALETSPSESSNGEDHDSRQADEGDDDDNDRDDDDNGGCTFDSYNEKGGDDDAGPGSVSGKESEDSVVDEENGGSDGNVSEEDASGSSSGSTSSRGRAGDTSNPVPGASPRRHVSTVGGRRRPSGNRAAAGPRASEPPPSSPAARRPQPHGGSLVGVEPTSNTPFTIRKVNGRTPPVAASASQSDIDAALRRLQSIVRQLQGALNAEREARAAVQDELTAEREARAADVRRLQAELDARGDAEARLERRIQALEQRSPSRDGATAPRNGATSRRLDSERPSRHPPAPREASAKDPNAGPKLSHQHATNGQVVPTGRRLQFSSSEESDSDEEEGLSMGGDRVGKRHSGVPGRRLEGGAGDMDSLKSSLGDADSGGLPSRQEWKRARTEEDTAPAIRLQGEQSAAAASRAGGNTCGSGAVANRPRPRLFTYDEVQAIHEGISNYRVGEWEKIKLNSRGRLDAWSTVEIRDKYRNMVRTFQI
jgi:hypothetical protein